MFRKTTLMALLVASTVSLSGCSSMWSGMGSFSNYMAEKTEWASLPKLRGSKKAKTTDVTSEAALSETPTSSLESFVVSEKTTVLSATSYAPVVTPLRTVVVVPAKRIQMPCPDGTFMTDENTCQILF